MKTVFMGTPDFAVSALEALIDGGHEVAGVVTQPDKPKGRGKKMQFPPVKEAALKAGIPVYQPERVRGNEEFLAELEQIRPDVIVVAAYGQILPQRLLDLPAYGCVNIHASLLPKYRGASPIQNAILNGDPATGITTMRMEAGLDTGDIIEQREIPIAEKETGGSLQDKLAHLGGEMILSTLKKIEDGTAEYKKQDDAAASRCGKIEKQTGALDFSKTARELERLIRALDPWPGTFTRVGGKNIKVWSADALVGEPEGGKRTDGAMTPPDPWTSAQRPPVPGEVVAFGLTEHAKDRLLVQTGEGILAIRELQPEGKRRMTAGDYLRGYPMERYTVLGQK